MSIAPITNLKMREAIRDLRTMDVGPRLRKRKNKQMIGILLRPGPIGRKKK